MFEEKKKKKKWVWTLTAFSVRRTRHNVGHGDDETRVGQKRKTSQLAYHNKCFWLNVSDSAAGHKAPLITVCRSC